MNRRRETDQPQWLVWARALQAHAQNGLTYSRDPYDLERFSAIRALAAEIMTTYTAADMRRISRLFDEQAGYATPKVDVRAVVFRDDRLLMVREKLDGGWTLPGGWADVGESPSEAVTREVYEESGYRVRAAKLLAVYDRNRHGHPPNPGTYTSSSSDVNCWVARQRRTSKPMASTSSPKSDCPELSLSRTVPSEIQRMFEHHRHPTGRQILIR